MAFGPAWFILLYAIPLMISWFVIHTAVLAALRRHDRDSAIRRSL